MYLALLTLPALGSIVAGLLGRKVGVTGSHIITCTCLVLSALLSLVAFYEVGLCDSPVSINLLSWIDSEVLDISWGFLFDSLTVSMLLPVLVVSSLVHIFSVDYMSADPHNQRFFSYLSMFTFFMLVLVTGDNYLLMFVGWEGIGISSYLLINFWYTRIQANKSAIKALTVNRVGDMFLSVGFFVILFVFGNLDYSTVFSLSPFVNESAITLIGILLLLAAMGKSAQLGLHTWLPDAMEGWVYFDTNILTKLHGVEVFSSLSDVSYVMDAYVENPSVLSLSLLLTVDKKVLGSITGCMLGDGHIQRRSKNPTAKVNARYQITIKSSSIGYIESLCREVFHFSLAGATTHLLPYPNVLLPHHEGKTVEQYSFSTKTLPFFTTLHGIWYKWDDISKKSKKILPTTILELFTVESLVHWIIQDGYFDNYGRTQTVLFCTESFTKEECQRLQEVLRTFQLKSSLKVRNKKKGTYRIRISKNSMKTLQNLVSSMMPAEFHYKIGM